MGSGTAVRRRLTTAVAFTKTGYQGFGRSRPVQWAWLDLNQRPHPYQGSAPELVSPGWDLRPGRTMYGWRPLETTRNRSAPMACGPTVDQARPARGGSGAPRRGPLAGKGDPRRLPPTSEPRSGNRLVRGSPGGVRARDIPLYRRAVPGHRHGGTPARLVFKPRGRWWVPWTTWHHEADQSWCPDASARPLGRWDSNPASSSSGVAGRRLQGALTCGFSLPVVTARTRREPGVPDLMRTQRGPAAVLFVQSLTLRRSGPPRLFRHRRVSTRQPDQPGSPVTVHQRI